VYLIYYYLSIHTPWFFGCGAPGKTPSMNLPLSACCVCGEGSCSLDLSTWMILFFIF